MRSDCVYGWTATLIPTACIRYTGLSLFTLYILIWTSLIVLGLGPIGGCATKYSDGLPGIVVSERIRSVLI